MECLDLNESGDCSNSSASFIIPEEEASPRRSLRRRSMSVPTENRRVKQKPTKKVTKLESIYLCRSVKRLPPNLETIFEEPKIDKNSEILYIGLRKQKRIISFENCSTLNRNKVKKRQMKAKKVSKSFMKRKRASMETLIEKLKYVE